MTKFAAILAPGRFDATPAEAQAAWDDYRKHADLILATEYGSAKFGPALKADGWDHFRGECVVSWATDTFALAWPPSADRIGTPFFRGGNENAQTPLTSVPLRHLATGTLLMVRVSHMPAHIQAGDGFRKTTARVIKQAAAWSTSLVALGRRSRRFRRHHAKAAELIAADWNADMHRAHWRTLIGRTLRLRCAKPLTKRGDLGKRLVSWVFARGLQVESTAVLAKRAGFDHAPLLFHLTIKES